MLLKNHYIANGTKVGHIKIASFTFECLVLENNECTLTLASIHKNFGYTGNSTLWLYTILESLQQRTTILKETLNSYKNPLGVQIKASDKESNYIETVSLSSFLDTCQVLLLLNSESTVLESERVLPLIAKKILGVIKTTNITELIEEVTGQALNKEHALFVLDTFFSKQTNDPAFRWIKTFPKFFWQVLFEIHDINWVSIKENPVSVGKILSDIVFSRFTDSLMEEIRSIKPKRTYKRKGNQLQKNEHSEIKEYISSITTLLKITNNNWPVFLQLLNRIHPINPNYKTKLTLFSVRETEDKPILSNFNKILIKTS